MTLVQERTCDLLFAQARTRLMISMGRAEDAKAAAIHLAQAAKRWLDLPLLTSCAWCHKVLQDGRTAPDGIGSHGICPACFELEKELW